MDYHCIGVGKWDWHMDHLVQFGGQPIVGISERDDSDRGEDIHDYPGGAVV